MWKVEIHMKKRKETIRAVTEARKPHPQSILVSSFMRDEVYDFHQGILTLIKDAKMFLNE